MRFRANDTLQEDIFNFDKSERLAGVLMTLSNNGLDEIVEFLKPKYKLTQKVRPFVGDKFAAFEATNVQIELDAPHLGFDMNLRFIRDDLDRQFRTQSTQEKQEKKRAEQSRF
jgi:hypothetical protein